MSGAREGIDFLLEPYRVLDLCDERGLLAGKILADLGADVIQIEPPGGSSALNIGPFYGDDPHPDKSLFWLHSPFFVAESARTGCWVIAVPVCSGGHLFAY